MRLLSATISLFIAIQCAVAAGSVTHRFLKAGWKSGGPAIVGKDGKIEWQIKDDRELSDAWYLPDGGVVYSFSMRKEGKAGIIRLSPEKKEMWTYWTTDGRDNHSCQPLPGGGFLAGEVARNGAWMVEIDKNGKKVKEIKVNLTVKDMHHTFRHVRKTPDGTYIAAIMKGGKAYEWDANGKVIRTFPDGNFTAVRLPNGNTVTSSRKGVIEYGKNGEVVWSLTKVDFEKLGLRVQMICGFQRLANGNTVISNVGHGNITKSGKLYKVFEITRDKKFVWGVDDPQFAKVNLGSIQVIDEPGDPEKFEVLK